jgi:putative tricarboxylic transport membrane protein
MANAVPASGNASSFDEALALEASSQAYYRRTPVKKFNFTIIGVVGAFSFFIFYLITQFPAKVTKTKFGPAFFPELLLLIIGILLVVLVLENMRSQDTTNLDFSDMRLPACMMGLVGITTFIFEYLGFVLSGFIFLVPAMLLLKARPRTAVIASVLVVAFIYIVFKVILRVPLPVGSLLGG